jgi:hypothetical protein
VWASVCGIVCACGESVCELLEASKGESVNRLRGLEGQGFALMVRHRKVPAASQAQCVGRKAGLLVAFCLPVCLPVMPFISWRVTSTLVPLGLYRT